MKKDNEFYIKIMI